MGNTFLHLWQITIPDIPEVQVPVMRPEPTTEDDLIHASIYYAEWGRKIVTISVYVTDTTTLLKQKFPGLLSRNRSMIGLSSPNGFGSHDCLVNMRTRKIVGITYNNRIEKVEIVVSLLGIVGVANIVAEYAWPVEYPWSVKYPYTYAFGLDPCDYQPSGSANSSMI